MNDDLPKDLIPSPPSLPEIKKVDSLIGLTNDLMLNNIEQMFNTAFCLLNSDDEIDSSINYYQVFVVGEEHSMCSDFNCTFTEENGIAANKLLDSIILLNPTNYLAYILKGIAKIKSSISGQFSFEVKEIIEDFTKGLDIKSNSIAAYFWRAFTYDVFENYPLSISDYTKVIEIKSDLYLAWNRRGIVNDYMGKYKEAIYDLSKALEIEPNCGVSYFHRASCKQEIRDYQGALMDYSKFIDIPLNNKNDILLKNKYERLKMIVPDRMEWCSVYGEIDDITNALKNQPNNFELIKKRAVLNRCTNNMDQAIDDYKRAIFLRKNDAELFLGFGYVKHLKKDYIGAIEEYSNAIDIDPNYTDAYRNCGDSKREIKDYIGAIEDYTKAIEIKPNDADAFSRRAKAKFELKDYKGAKDDYTKSLEINPNDFYLFMYRGETNVKISDYNSAILDYKKALEIQPYSDWAKQKLYDLIPK